MMSVWFDATFCGLSYIYLYQVWCLLCCAGEKWFKSVRALPKACRFVIIGGVIEPAGNCIFECMVLDSKGTVIECKKMNIQSLNLQYIYPGSVLIK